ncbi:MAG: cytidine/deoxycytidylate deaminase family protein [Oscillospiraceae bacterium]|nr:cytidine/deoxycytidylate deaminase family protein [Oscillospiraceae bacterium]
MNRRDKINYYLDIAEAVSERSTCLRRKFGAIIVKNDEIISTGYNGAPRGRKNCSDLNFCYRERMQVPRGQRYELCRSVHAEANAIISASRSDLLGAALYLACHDAKTDQLDGAVAPCSMCKRLILNAGITEVIIRQDKDSHFTIRTADWITDDDSLADDLEKTGY